MSDLEAFGIIIHKVRGKGYRLSDSVSLLDKNRIMSSMAPALRKELGIVDVSLESGSTNQTALTSHYSSAQWHLYATEYQSAGKGRRGRQWVSPLGANLLFSLSSKRLWNVDVLYLASILTGLAVVRCLQAYCKASVKIKWPNDIYIDQKKAAGILCELRGSPQDEALLVVGLGINVSAAPGDTDIPSTCLNRYGTGKIDRSRLVAELSEAVIRDLDVAHRTGVQPLLDSWQTVDYLYGQQVTVIQGEKSITGTACGIDPKGQLLLKRDNGSVESYNGGEVSVRW